MTSGEIVREDWRRRGVAGHCPVCHRHDWDEGGDVALPAADGGEPIRAGLLQCANCGSALLVIAADGGSPSGA